MKLRLLTVVSCSILQIPIGGITFADAPAQGGRPVIARGIIDRALVSIAYMGTEKFHYEVAYTGGIKLGELELEVHPVAGMADHYELYSLVTTEGGTFHAIYPLRDVYITRVSGEGRLPYHYEVWQHEGYGYEAHKITTYDQAGGWISHQRNDDEVVRYQVAAPVHNEFSAFFASRLMDFGVGGSFLVPTVADKKRIEVEVKVLDKVHFAESVLGPVDTFQVSPILKFKGLYDKRGDTVIWYTDDECRVPVKITSKLAIGSITATLLSYENPLCGTYAQTAQQEN